MTNDCLQESLSSKSLQCGNALASYIDRRLSRNSEEAQRSARTRNCSSIKVFQHLSYFVPACACHTLDSLQPLRLCFSLCFSVLLILSLFRFLFSLSLFLSFIAVYIHILPACFLRYRNYPVSSTPTIVKLAPGGPRKVSHQAMYTVSHSLVLTIKLIPGDATLRQLCERDDKRDRQRKREKESLHWRLLGFRTVVTTLFASSDRRKCFRLLKSREIISHMDIYL